VLRGEAKLGEKKVDIVPPDPIGELGSGWEKIARDKITGTNGSGGTPTRVTIGGV